MQAHIVNGQFLNDLVKEAGIVEETWERVSGAGPYFQPSFQNHSPNIPILYIYCKIPKISPGAYIFQRPFLRGLYSDGLIYTGKFAFQN